MIWSMNTLDIKDLERSTTHIAFPIQNIFI